MQKPDEQQVERKNETGIPHVYTMRDLYDKVMEHYHCGAHEQES